MTPGSCVHLTIRPGVRYVCALGHDPEALAGGPQHGIALRMPCRTAAFWEAPLASGRGIRSTPGQRAEIAARGSCADYREPTAEELAEYKARMDRGFAEHMAALAAGKCPTCGADVEPRRQVGRCIYAACGHRLGQGRLRGEP